MSPAWTPKPEITKLPMPIRKDLRDNYDPKVAEYESKINDLLGFPLTININVNEVCAYANLTYPGVAAQLLDYLDGFVSAVEHCLRLYGTHGQEYFQNAVSGSGLTLTVNELGEKAQTIDADIKDGCFRILFHPNQFGINAGSLMMVLVDVINTAPHDALSPFPLIVRHSIETQYDDKVEEVRSEIARILNQPGVILDPNFEENVAKLAANEKNKDWQHDFGNTTLNYFGDGLLSQLKQQGFEGDDMLQDGFAETVTSNTIKLSVVDEIADIAISANETKLEEDSIHINTVPDRWGVNIQWAGFGIVGLL